MKCVGVHDVIEVLTALNNFIHEHKEWGVVAETWQSSLRWHLVISGIQGIRLPVSPPLCARATHTNFASYALENFKFNSYS